MLRTDLVSLAAMLALAPLAGIADTELSNATAAGGEVLTAEEIAVLLPGSSVTARSGEKIFEFRYSTDNVLRGELQGGGWSDTGFYGITDTNQVCVSMSKDKGRLRCLTIVRQDGVVRKYNAAGKMTFELLTVKKAGS